MAYYASNVAGLILLVIALRWTRIARALFVIMFGYAAYINFTTGLYTPEVYLDYALSAVPLYAEFINGWFSRHIAVFIGAIGLGQLAIAVGMLMNKKIVVLSCIGIVAFLIAISPLGYYAAFPFSVTVSIAAIAIAMRDAKDYLWKHSFSFEASVQEKRGGATITGPS